jgi:uncharacterized membrane protein YhaH (DUF805 family)
MDWYLLVLKKYAVFEGRARRKEYWYFVLFNTLIVIGLGVLDALFFQTSPDQKVGVLVWIYWLAVFIPSVAVQVRRLHDTGRSGWWLLLYAIPLIGPIVLIVFFCTDSDAGTNQYGVNPKI